jgi:ABC-type lipoprotein export system ATPase subunit
VLITHDHDVARAADRIVNIFDGTVASDASLEKVAG